MGVDNLRQPTTAAGGGHVAVLLALESYCYLLSSPVRKGVIIGMPYVLITLASLAAVVPAIMSPDIGVLATTRLELRMACIGTLQEIQRLLQNQCHVPVEATEEADGALNGPWLRV